MTPFPISGQIIPPISGPLGIISKGVLFPSGMENEDSPIYDGSCKVHSGMLLDEAGIMEQRSPKRILRVKRRVEVRDGDKFVRLEPSKSGNICFKIDFKPQQ